MKKALLFVFMGVFALGAAMMSSCSDDGGGNGDGGGGGNLKKSDLIGKWETGTNSLGVVSVEFGVSNDYVAVVDESLARAVEDYVAYYGTYSISGDEVTLSNLGTMTVNSVGGGAIDFTFEPQSGGSVEFTGEKAQEMASTTKTDLLCRTWRVVDHETNNTDPQSTDLPEHIYFSKAGTYLLSYDDGYSDLANWKWKSEAEGKFYYSWRFPPVWEEDKVATIETLTATSLVVYDEYGGIWDRTFLEPK
jgi:hypothetical protein